MEANNRDLQVKSAQELCEELASSESACLVSDACLIESACLISDACLITDV